MEDEVDESEVVEAREIFARFLDVGLDVIIIMTRVTRLKDERETGRQKERERERGHARASPFWTRAQLFALNRILMHSSRSFAARSC
jgi:hypothetical protein